MSFCYVARKKCGCIIAAIVDNDATDEKARKPLADSVASWVKAGFAVERVTDEEVREWFRGYPCPHEATQTSMLSDIRARIVPVRD